MALCRRPSLSVLEILQFHFIIFLHVDHKIIPLRVLIYCLRMVGVRVFLGGIGKEHQKNIYSQQDHPK